MIKIGTAGYSYQDWRGHFYPEDISDRDMLPFYAQRFSMVEVDSTYYRIPHPQMMRGISRKTPKDFTFAVKANKAMTHERESGEEVFEKFRDSLNPLVEEKKLGCVLAQFPFSFKNTPENRDYLMKLEKMMEGIPTVLEFRHSSWFNEPSFQFIRKHHFGFCCVDEPRLRGLLPPVAVATGNIGYVRFHGRNAAKWWNHEEAWERYDYLYTEEELKEWVPKIKEIEDKTEVTYIVMNNHYQAKAVKNAEMLKDMLF
ncbi:MAG: DUF72 domain-containing protein [bacterium]